MAVSVISIVLVKKHLLPLGDFSVLIISALKLQFPLFAILFHVNSVSAVYKKCVHRYRVKL